MACSTWTAALVSLNLSGVSHEVLRALASECAAVLESAKLVAAEQAALQYRKEMDIAASIQRSLTSASKVETDFVRVNACSIPCREVGGDFFDVHVSPDAVTVIVADVSGKGVSAALLASVIHGMFYAQMTSGARLVDAIASVNTFLCSRVAGQKYATLLAAQLNRDGKLALVNCGHVPAILAQDGKVTHVEDGDMPVGLIAEVDFHVIERELPAGIAGLHTDRRNQRDGKRRRSGVRHPLDRRLSVRRRTDPRNSGCRRVFLRQRRSPGRPHSAGAGKN